MITSIGVCQSAEVFIDNYSKELMFINVMNMKMEDIDTKCVDTHCGLLEPATSSGPTTKVFDPMANTTNAQYFWIRREIPENTQGTKFYTEASIACWIQYSRDDDGNYHSEYLPSVGYILGTQPLNTPVRYNGCENIKLVNDYHIEIYPSTTYLSNENRELSDFIDIDYPNLSKEIKETALEVRTGIDENFSSQLKKELNRDELYHELIPQLLTRQDKNCSAEYVDAYELSKLGEIHMAKLSIKEREGCSSPLYGYILLDGSHKSKQIFSAFLNKIEARNGLLLEGGFQNVPAIGPEPVFIIADVV